MDLFEQIKIMSMSDAEKMELFTRGDEYLRVLSKDDSFAVRIRAKKLLNESDSDAHERRLSDIAYLKEEAQSHIMGRRLKAKILLRKLEEEGA